MGAPSPIEKRLEENSAGIPFCGCRIWLGSVNAGGYGTVGRNRRSMLAHRAAWEAAGRVIPKGMLVLHRCDVRSCINVDHLFIGTHLDNARDCINKGRDRKAIGSSNSAAKLTAAQVVAIRADPRGSRRVAPDYRVSDVLVRKIRQRVIWRHLP